MSYYALEQALWELGREPELAAAFREQPEDVSRRYRLDDDERRMLCELDIKAMAKREVSTLLLMMAWHAIQGPGSIPEYMQRMNAPSA